MLSAAHDIVFFFLLHRAVVAKVRTRASTLDVESLIVARAERQKEESEIERQSVTTSCLWTQLERWPIHAASSQ